VDPEAISIQLHSLSGRHLAQLEYSGCMQPSSWVESSATRGETVLLWCQTLSKSCRSEFCPCCPLPLDQKLCVAASRAVEMVQEAFAGVDPHVNVQVSGGAHPPSLRYTAGRDALERLEAPLCPETQPPPTARSNVRVLRRAWQSFDDSFDPGSSTVLCMQTGAQVVSTSRGSPHVSRNRDGSRQSVMQSTLGKDSGTHLT